MRGKTIVSVMLVVTLAGALCGRAAHAAPLTEAEAKTLGVDAYVYGVDPRAHVLFYWPKEKSPSILDGSWTLPGVKQASM